MEFMEQKYNLSKLTNNIKEKILNNIKKYGGAL
jgi:predicted small metal-binding protein